jgi:hypothetical protein
MAAMALTGGFRIGGRGLVLGARWRGHESREQH